MSWFTMMSIVLYSSLVVASFDFDSLVIKFIMTSFHDDSDDVWYWISPYLACISCLFCWQLRHLLMYVSTCCLMLRNWQLCHKSCSILLTSEWPLVDSSWCFLMHSLILSSNICSFSCTTEYSFLSSLMILNVAFNSCLFIKSDPSLLTLRILCLNIFLIFMWSLLLLRASALLLFFSDVYRILNLYCSSNSDYQTCHQFNYFIVVNWSRFL